MPVRCFTLNLSSLNPKRGSGHCRATMCICNMYMFMHEPYLHNMLHKGWLRPSISLKMYIHIHIHIPIHIHIHIYIYHALLACVS